MDALLNTFAVHDSLSVQQTLYAMGKTVLDAAPDISEIKLSMRTSTATSWICHPWGPIIRIIFLCRPMSRMARLKRA